MILSLIILIVLIVFFAFFVGLNIQNTCTFWFFKTFENVPVATLALIAFASGIVIALLVVLIAKLRTPAKVEVVREEKPAKEKDLKKEIRKIEAKNRKLKFGKKKADSTNGGETSAQPPVEEKSNE